MEIARRISVSEEVRFGKPVITGTRVPVELVVGKLAAGMTYEEVMSEYDITRDDILAALDYAAKCLSGEEIKAAGQLLAFVVDEDMPRSTGRVLADQGHEVLDVRNHGLRGADDQAVFRFAQDNGAVLVTGDMGFGNILRFPIGSHCGIVIAHFPNESTVADMNRRIVDSLADLAEHAIHGNLVIIEPNKTRIRKHGR